MLTLGQLQTPITPEEAIEEILSILQSIGFQATSWQEGSWQRNFFQLFANVYSDLTYTVRDITNSYHPKLAKGPYANLLGQYNYDLERFPAQAATGKFTLTASLAAAPLVYSPGSLLVSDKPEGDDANVYEILGSGTLNPGSSVSVLFQCTTPGSKGNIPSNSTLYLWTPVAGISATNPPDPSSGTWISTEGAEEESDDHYGNRMVLRWGSISAGAIEEYYRYHCFQSLPELTDVTVREALPMGTVRIVGRTADGGLDPSQIAQMQAYFEGPPGHRAINDVLDIVGATVVTTPALSVTVTCQNQFASDVASRVSASLTSLFGSLPIGGKIVGNSSVGKVLLADMYATIMALQGVVNVAFNVSQDIILSSEQIYSPTISVTVLRQ